jgi:2-oxoglutarate ferredoxin oxidoreductase subunit alpha
MAKELLKGNVAIAEAAIRAGCQAYFGYPITPQTELLEHMSQRMPELGRVFLQAESEVAAINMVYGAACAGVRTMTSSSSPGISLMQEGFSYIACSEVPAVIVDVMRGGPGLGNIQPSQSDYNQIVKTAGHGDFRPIVLAPSTIQEAIDLMALSFDLADQYRTLVIMALDGAIGQMMEPAELPPMSELPKHRPAWALTGASSRSNNVITSLYLGADALSVVNERLQAKLARIEESEVRYEELFLDDAQFIIVAFGTSARVAQTAVKRLREANLPVGVFRPITLWPFPEEALQNHAQHARAFLTVEMNAGQMVHDVQKSVGPNVQTDFLGCPGGIIPVPEDIEDKARAIWRQIEVVHQHL